MSTTMIFLVELLLNTSLERGGVKTVILGYHGVPLYPMERMLSQVEV